MMAAQDAGPFDGCGRPVTWVSGCLEGTDAPLAHRIALAALMSRYVDSALGRCADLGLLVGAIITAWYARKAFKAQSKELVELQAEGADQRKVNERQIAVLELQHRELEASLKQREADAAAARSAQASKIYVWTEEQQAGNRRTSAGLGFFVSGLPEEIISAGPSVAVYVTNMSSGPIYDVVVRTDHGADDHLSRLLPGAFAVFYKPPEAARAVSDFRDANLALWSRETSGLLVDRGDKRAEATGEVFEVPNRPAGQAPSGAGAGAP